MTYYALLFLAGFAGSFHCIGMCGGFACALGADPRGAGATSVRHVLYNTGRLTTYCFLGGSGRRTGPGDLHILRLTARNAAAPFLSASLDAGQRALAVMAGLLMIIMALSFFGLRGWHRVTSGFGSSTLVISLRSLLAQARAMRRRSPSVCSTAFCRVRWSTPWSPRPRVPLTCCPAVSPWRRSAWALSRPCSPWAASAGCLRRRWRQRGVRLAGSFILALGLVTLGRGVVPMAAGHGLHHLWHIA